MTTPHKMPVPDRITVANPAAGANWTFTNADGGLLLVRGVAFLFTTSVAAANRVVGLAVGAGGVTWLSTSSGLAQITNLAVPYCAFAANGSASLSIAGCCIPWRNDGVLLRPGHTLASVTAAIDAADQYSAIVLDVVRYLPDYPYAAQPYLAGFRVDTGD